MFSTSVILISLQKQTDNIVKSHAKVFFAKAEQISAFYIDQVRSTLQVMQQSASLSRFIQHPNDKNQALLTLVTQHIIHSQSSIDQVRLINKRGTTIINFSKSLLPHSGLKVVSDHDKSVFADFRRVALLKPGGIWFSKMTQRIDAAGKSKPVLEVGLPIYIDNIFAGAVVAELNVRELLHQLLMQEDVENYLLDRHGYILYSNQSSITHWERYVHSPYMSSEPKGLQVWLEQGFSTYRLSHIIPNQDGLILASRAKNVFREGIGIPGSTYAILLVSTVIVLSIPIGVLFAWKPIHNQIMLNKISVESQGHLDIINQYVPVVITDSQGDIQQCNDAFSQLTGYAKDELIGRSYGILSHPLAINEVQFSMFRTLLPGRQWQGEFHSQARNGQELWLHTSIIPRFDENEQLNGYMAIFTDRTDRKMVERMAERDPLTSIYNRMKIDELLRSHLAKSKKSDQEFSIILIDVDYFKAINDEYGHLVGDNTLIEITRVLQHALNEPNVIGRWGGEEFIVICPWFDYTEAYHLANKLCTTVSEHSFRNVGQVTISLGVSSSRGKASVAELLNEADLGLYEAKDRGRCQVAGCLTVEEKEIKEIEDDPEAAEA
jgi:diguanylate cyclase (GGDEF)-like protein/PAS domain S-box-containing protein